MGLADRQGSSSEQAHSLRWRDGEGTLRGGDRRGRRLMRLIIVFLVRVFHDERGSQRILGLSPAPIVQKTAASTE
jgi:hypothetical protein